MRLTEALALGGREMIAMVGGGGKTAALYRLAREGAEDGGRVVVCGTMLFTPPPDRIVHPIVLADDEDTLVEATARILRNDAVVVATMGHGSEGRLLPVPREAPARLAAIPGVTRVIIEADGWRRRPFKASEEHAAVIPVDATLVVAVAAMGALGQPLDEEHLHDPERGGALTGADDDASVTEAIIAQTLAHHAGRRKGVPSSGCRFAAMLDQVDDANLDAARRIARLIAPGGVDRVVLAHARDEPPVIEVLLT